MALPTEDVEVKTSSETAQHFLNDYYAALNHRQKLEPFYVNSCAQYTSTKADISINGAVLAGPAELQALLDRQHGDGGGAFVQYNLESFDAHTVNPNFNLDAPDHLLAPDKSGAKASVLVSAVGRIQYGRGPGAAEKNFTEVFVLVPNWDAFGRGGGGGAGRGGARRRLIMSQNFRSL